MELLQLDKIIHKKLTANVIINDERLDDFPQDQEYREGVHPYYCLSTWQRMFQPVHRVK